MTPKKHKITNWNTVFQTDTNVLYRSELGSTCRKPGKEQSSLPSSVAEMKLAHSDNASYMIQLHLTKPKQMQYE